MPTISDRKDELVRSLHRLGADVLDLIASIHDQIVVLDRERRVIAALGDLPDEQRSEDLVGKTLRETFGRPSAADVHETAYARALQNESTTYEWTRGKGRDLLRLSTTVSPLRDTKSKTVGVVMITRKVSSAGRDFARGATPRTQRTKGLLALEQGIQQLAGAIRNFRRTAALPLEQLGAESRLHRLSARERQVLDLLCEGYRPRSISQTLHVSPETVRNHLKAMFKKTGTHSQEELIALVRGSTHA